MRSTILAGLAILALSTLSGCCVLLNAMGVETSCADPAAAIESDAYPSYTGAETETLDAVDVKAHVPHEGEPYYTFRFNRANPADPSVCNESGKLCSCDVASTTVLEAPLTLSSGATKPVTRVVYRRGALGSDSSAPCPDRGAGK